MKRTTELYEDKRKKRKIVRIRKKRKNEDMQQGGKRKKRGRRKFIVFWFLLVCAAIIVAAFAVLKAPFFSIKSVECEGQSNLSYEQIIKTSQLKVGANIFATNIDAAEKRLEAHPEIVDARIKRVFPNKIKVSVKEAVVIAYVENDGKFLLLDSAGKIIKIHPADAVDTVKGIARIEGVEIASQKPGEKIAVADDPRAGELFKCIDILQNLGMIDKINYINFGDLSDLHIEYEERLYMLMGSYDNLEYKLKFVKKVIDESISKFENALLDFRGNKLYVRPRDEQQADVPPEVSEGTEGTTGGTAEEGETIQEVAENAGTSEGENPNNGENLTANQNEVPSEQSGNAENQ